MITLTDAQLASLTANMVADIGRDHPGQLVELALTDPARVAFNDGTPDEFSPETVAAIVDTFRRIPHRCACCGELKRVSEWTRDSAGLDLCADCLADAEAENEHNDYHTAPVASCRYCAAERYPLPYVATMAIGRATYNALADAIAPIDDAQTRDRYRRRDIPRAAAVRDIDKRYRWDLYWSASAQHRLPRLPLDMTDSQIDTALRRIVAPLAPETRA